MQATTQPQQIEVPLNEKYRPQTLDQVIGQEETIQQIQALLRNDYLFHMILVGNSGTGKTTVAKIIAREIKRKWIEKDPDANVFIKQTNASDDRGIDYVRNELSELVRLKSKGVIILDEADALTAPAQDAMRGLIEEANRNGKIFILTGNYEHRFLPAIKSRCRVFRFRKLTWKEIGNRLVQIAVQEGVEVPKTKEMAEFFKFLSERAEGDLRIAIDMLQSTIVVHEDGRKTIDTSVVKDFMGAKRLLEETIQGIFADPLSGEPYYSSLTFIDQQLREKTVSEDDLLKWAYEWGAKNLKNHAILAEYVVAVADTEARLKLGTNPLIQLSYLFSRIQQIALSHHSKHQATN